MRMRKAEKVHGTDVSNPLIQELEVDLERERNKFSQLETEHTKCLSSLDDYRATIQNLGRQLQKQEEDAKAASHQMRQYAEEELSSLREELRLSQKTTAQIDERFRDLTVQLTATRTAAEDVAQTSHTQIETLEAQLTTLRREMTTIQQDLASATEQIARNDAAFSQRDEEALSQSQHIAQLQLQLEQCNASAAASEAQSLQALADALAAKVTADKTSAALEAKLKQSSAEIDTLQSRSVELEAQVVKSQEEVRVWENKHSKVATAHQSADTRIVELEAQVVKSQEEVRVWENKHSKVATAHQSADTRIVELAAQADKDKETIITLQRRIATLEGQQKKAREDLVAVTKKHNISAELREKSDRQASDYRNQLEKSLEEVAALTRHASEMAGQESKTQQVMLDLKTQIIALTSTREEAAQKVQQLELETTRQRALAQQQEQEFQQQLLHKRTAVELDRQRIADLQEVNDRLRRFARDRTFQESLTRPLVRLALDCWSGASISHLNESEMEAIKNDPGVLSIYDSLKEFEKVCDEFKLPFPIDHLIASATELSKEAVEYAYGKDFIALHHYDLESIQGTVDFIPIARPHSVTSTPDRSRSRATSADAPVVSSGGSRPGSLRNSLTRGSSFVYTQYKVDDVMAMSPERAETWPTSTPSKS